MLMVSKQARDYVVKAYPAAKNSNEASYAEVGLPVQCFPDRLYDIVQALRDHGTDEKNSNSEMQTRVIVLRGKKDRIEGSGSEAVPTFALQGRNGGPGKEWVILAQETEPRNNRPKMQTQDELTNQQRDKSQEQSSGFGKGKIQIERMQVPPRGRMNTGNIRNDSGRDTNDYRSRNNRDTRRPRGGDDFRQKGRGYQHNPNHQPIIRNSYSNSGNGQQNYQGNNTINMAPFQGQDLRYPASLGPNQIPTTSQRWSSDHQGYQQQQQQHQQQQHQGQQRGPVQNHIGRDDFYDEY